MHLLSALSRTAASAVTHVAAVAAPSGFAAILSALGLADAPAGGEGRQADADTGKPLPEREPIDPATIPPVMPPVMIVPPPQFAVVAAPMGGGVLPAAALPTPAITGSTTEATGVARAVAAETPPAPVPLPAPPAAASVVPPSDPAATVAVSVPTDMLLHHAGADASAPAPAPPEPAATTVDTVPPPARPRPLMVGEEVAPRITIALAATDAVVAADKPAERHRRDGDAVGIADLSTLDTMVARPVAAAAAPDRGALDMHDDQWMQGMIDHIETLRGESGGVGETRIRLSPDALGGMEIAIDTTDDGVRVRFASDNPDAARLLADAQPRLAELAEARGLKLGGMQVDMGQPQQQPRREPPAPAAPPRFNRPAAPDAPVDSIHTDIRIA